MRTPILRGKKVILRPLSLRDAKNFCKWLKDPEVTRFLEIHEQEPPTLKEEREYIQKKKKGKTSVQFSIDARDGAHIGTVALDAIDAYNKRAVFGIFIGNKRYWGQGLGTEAGRMMVEYGFHRLRLRRIFLHVYDFNVRGYKSYRKIGFKKEGVLREHRLRNGHFHGEIVMGILQKEYIRRKK